MRIIVVAAGRARGTPEDALFAEYAKRLKPSPGGIGPLECREIESKAKVPSARKADEGERLLAQMPDGGFLVALDPRGKALSTEDFSRQLARWRDESIGTVTFAIGGADGLDGAVLDAARFRLCLGSMTWPHLLARAMLAEQIWRAASILAGHPYHRA
ncbi:MAG: 23S rRNA (pseudouridine(1915)-N(3))-methyltransferase RlmH [Alphaproteobacteria bacterium]|nr:23S rRNA (pseudouridine(1915)-N(3))-methyltransferase RlmH [Alphaproteobacteria bacterium]